MQSITIRERQFILRCSKADYRSRDRAALIYDIDGNIKSIYLERSEEKAQTVNTAVGVLDCEMVTFYPNGNLHRVFPVYGKISGFWSEEEEVNLLPVTYLKNKDITFHGKISCVCFYPDESLKSITLWPGEETSVFVNEKEYKIRYGISFYESGAIKSFEPAVPVKITQKAGTFYAYDFMATGVTGDFTSLCFYEDGCVRSLKSNVTGLLIRDKKGVVQEFYPPLVVNPLDIESEVLFPVRYEFSDEGITFLDSVGKVWKFLYENFEIKAKQLFEDESRSCNTLCSGNCDKCHK